jgi:hypothetical protein
LESARIGWRVMTSREAVGRFLEALNRRDTGAAAVA